MRTRRTPKGPPVRGARFALRRACVVLALLGAPAAGAHAQTLDGSASITFAVFPNVDAASGRSRATAEARPRVQLGGRVDIGSTVRLTASGFAEGVVADRWGDGRVTAGVVRPLELHAELVGPKADLRVGMSRLAWGRLDEFLPTDVVNPLDLTKFFLEGRSEARMPVAMIRGRLIPSDRFNVEAVYVPIFRRGHFDQVDEATAPFNVSPPGRRRIREPGRVLENAQGGLRVNATTKRVDWSLTAYRGFESLPVYDLEIAEAEAPDAILVETFPRFDMAGGDFETAWGAWGLRGEAAWFTRRLQAANLPISAEGRTIEAGLGIDRTGGSHRIGANVVVTQRRAAGLTALDERDTVVVLSFERSFARETRELRTFAAYNADDRSVFARVVLSWNLKDNVTLQTAGAWFDGQGVDVLSRFRDRDVGYVRLKVFF